MSIVIRWYSRRQDDYSTIWSEEHHGTIKGVSAAECMSKLQEFRNNHDCAKFTPTEIVYVYD